MNVIILSSMLMLNVSNTDLLTTVLVLEDNTTEGMTAINNVVWNRAKNKPKNIRKVLLKKYQFTCLNIHTVKKEPLQKLVEKAKSRSNWREANKIAQNTYMGRVRFTVKDAKHYHVYKGKTKCSPSWTHPSLGGKNHKCGIVGFIGYHVYLRGVDK